MERMHAWLLLVVAASLGAGVAAFLVAVPDHSSRIARDQLGFQRLDRDAIAERLDAAGAHHQAQHRATTLERAAGGAVRRWLVALPVGGTRPARDAALPAPAGRSAASRARVSSFAAWLDGLPASSVRITVGSAVPLDVEEAWAIDAVVHVELAQAREGTRRLQYPVVIEVAAPARAGARWRLLDAHVDAPRTWLRGYVDPVMLRGAAVNVVAPAAAAQDATRALALTDAPLVGLRRKLDQLRGSDRTTVWFVADRSRAGVQLGAPAARGAAGEDIAWLDERGELVVALDRWRAATAPVRERELQTALAHVAMLDGVDRVPRVLVEALAAVHAGTGRSALGDAATFAPSAGGRTIAELLLAEPGSALDHPAERRRADALAAWFQDAHGTASVVDLMARIEAGLDADRAVRRVLGATPVGVERRVDAWASADAREDREVRAPRTDEAQPPEQPMQ